MPDSGGALVSRTIAGDAIICSFHLARYAVADQGAPKTAVDRAVAFRVLAFVNCDLRLHVHVSLQRFAFPHQCGDKAHHDRRREDEQDGTRLAFRSYSTTRDTVRVGLVLRRILSM